LNLLATAEGATLLDFAAGNATACSVAAGQVFANSLPTTYNNSIFTVLVGANDAYTHGAGASEANFNTCQQAALSWLALPAQYKVTAQSASCVKTGNWQVFGPLPQSEMFSQSNGATILSQRKQLLCCADRWYGRPGNPSHQGIRIERGNAHSAL
jgi:hypothetical protein